MGVLGTYIWLVLLYTCSCQYTYPVDDTPGLGRVFNGIGAISGGGATSKLLVGYPQQQRDEIMDFLFTPNFGASLHIFKVEIGGDAQSSEGTEATHMRSPDDQNYNRGYEWWMMKEAKKRNPDIKLYGLPWGFPGWLEDPIASVYGQPERTAQYIANWVIGAKKYHNLTIDYIGCWNEYLYNTTYIKTLRKVLDSNGLQDTLIVAADYFKWDDFANDILNDPELDKAVYAMGVHYPHTNSTPLAQKMGKPLWASEDTSDRGVANWNRNYVNGYMTSTIVWSIVCSWYPMLPHFVSALMLANEPWSGHYELYDFLWLAAHTGQFTKPGWIYLKHGYGVGNLVKGGSYVSLVSPDKKDLTIIVEKMHQEDGPADIGMETITFHIQGTFAHITQLNCWKTFLSSYPGDYQNFMKEFPIQVVNGIFNLTIYPATTFTLTTLTTGNKGEHPKPPDSAPFPLSYTEDFEKYEEGEEPYYLAPQTGSFEVKDVGGAHGKVMRQMTLQKPVSWCQADFVEMGVAVVQTGFDSDVIECDIRVESGAHASKGAFIAARLDQGGCWLTEARGVFFFIFPQSNIFMVTTGADMQTVLASGRMLVDLEWNTVSLNLVDTQAVGFINGNMMFNITVPSDIKYGMAAVGSGSYGYADFDNLKIAVPFM
ncbi:galactocerebrosidase-like isoform X2 [Haliotis rufescens]|uniref:galactocerebrosidase-like isoform X2 n=1 Tax=Haliotis rufescens TaxID=6454 RepID=UPI00201EE051|nr:galactocerebrosidase-like isoform X2 [Haliotis rufescens]